MFGHRNVYFGNYGACLISQWQYINKNVYIHEQTYKLHWYMQCGLLDKMSLKIVRFELKAREQIGKTQEKHFQAIIFNFCVHSSLV